MNAYNTPIPNEYDEEDFWCHPICKTYEANRNGVVRNKFTKNVADYKDKCGYLRFPCYCCNNNGKKIKNYKNHRFIYECFHSLITDNRVIDHKNNIKSDNRLENLQLLTNRENCKKDAPPGRKLPPISVKAINIETGETYIYKSIYGTSKDLKINQGSIYRVLNGLTNTALSKKYNERFTFVKNTEQNPTIIKNKINKFKSNTININKC